MPRKTSADWRNEIADITSSMQALLDIAKDGDRDLEPEEESLFAEYNMKLEQAQASLGKAEEFESKKRHLAELQIQQSQPLAPIGGMPIRGAKERLEIRHLIGRPKNFKGDDPIRDAFDCGNWWKAFVARAKGTRDEKAEQRIQSRGWDVHMVATEGTPTAGGYLVPAPLATAIIDVRNIAGVARRTARVLPMASETLQIAKKTSGTTVTYPGEGGVITPSDMAWAAVNLTAKKRAILSHVSSELNDDAIIPIMDDLASQMGTDFAVKEDAEYINGDGSGTYGGEVGLLSALGTSGIATGATGDHLWSTLDLDDFLGAMALLPDKYWQYNPVWICSSAFYFAAMLRVMAEAGGNTISSIAAGAGNQPAFLGYPVFFTNQMPTATAVSTVSALFGAFTQAAIIGDRIGVAIAESREFRFSEDLISIRGVTRYDINVHESGDNASAPGAYVGVKTAAS